MNFTFPRCLSSRIMQNIVYKNHRTEQGTVLQFQIHHQEYTHLVHFNPLIPRREIQQYCIKICHYIFAVLPKIIRFPCLLFQKFSNFLLLTEKSDSYPRANHLQFSCELPVRTIMIYAIHKYLLLSNYVTSFFCTDIIPKRKQFNIFARKKAKHRKLCLVSIQKLDSIHLRYQTQTIKSFSFSKNDQ